MKNKKTYFGTLIIIGKSNTGKSTLLNKLMNKNISMTSFRKNSTEICITGIKTERKYQFVYLDTPGMIDNPKKREIIKRIIKKEKKCIYILYMTKYLYWDSNDNFFLKDIKKYNIPIILLINQIDKIKKKENLLPYIKNIKNKFNFSEILPISAKTGENINILLSFIKKKLFLSSHLYPEKYITHSSTFFMITEIIREQILFFLKKELPYNIKITVKSFKIINNNYYINSFIKTNHEKHKKIFIGKKGEMIKKISISSRKKIELNFRKKIHLFLKII
ncbi:GTPase Era [Buchnera aphidicola]|uniref:GTPase Era n=1 Tax=Buchnera aphidicola TaxID=9 RepID=UPI0031B6CD80